MNDLDDVERSIFRNRITELEAEIERLRIECDTISKPLDGKIEQLEANNARLLTELMTARSHLESVLATIRQLYDRIRGEQTAAGVATEAVKSMVAEAQKYKLP